MHAGRRVLEVTCDRGSTTQTGTQRPLVLQDALQPPEGAPAPSLRGCAEPCMAGSQPPTLGSTVQPGVCGRYGTPHRPGKREEGSAALPAQQ